MSIDNDTTSQMAESKRRESETLRLSDTTYSPTAAEEAPFGNAGESFDRGYEPSTISLSGANREESASEQLYLERPTAVAWSELAMPAIRRLSMVPSAIERQPLRWIAKRILADRDSRKRNRERNGSSRGAGDSTEARVNGRWRRCARWRRGVLLMLVLAQTVIATWSLTNTFPYPWLNGSEIAISGVFAILFSWISFGFWTAVMGFCVLWRRSQQFSLTELDNALNEERPLRSRTAVLMPICNEDVDRVFAGLEASYRSLAATGQLDPFDFYVLSDTGDAEKVVEEEIAWAETCRAVGGFGKIFYRHRRNNIKRKSGNIADFLRRWGRNYDYMVVFDADSVMAGETLVRLARIMDLHPEAGIVQTVPTLVNCDSLFARVQQFASRAYGPMLAAGIRFWQLGESYYWGHNAILRVAPFVRHCGLARLPGKAPLGGEILSHDFVEAGLMGKAGWEVWVVPELAGSYEELPPTLLDELKRDRRWCQGNIQHLRLLLSDAIRGGHRAILSTGIMAYASAFFWFVFLLLVTGEVVAKALLPPVYFSSQPSLFPIWPQWRPGWAIALLSTTIVLLFLPKFLSLLLIVKDRATRLFGGFIPLCTSIVLEILASTLLAPVRMWFHSKFVALTLMGREIKWGAQRRTGNQIGWGEALRFHGFSIIFSVGVVAVMSWLNPSFLWWLLPVLVPLLLSVPLSVYSSRIAAGSALHRWRLFLIPEEVDPPDVIRELQTSIAQRERNKWKPDPFVRAIIDPYANAIHAGLLHGKTSKSPEAVERNTRLREIALTQGPASLNRLEKAYLLRDAQSMAFLQAQVWQLRDPHLVAQWGIAELD